MPTCLPDSKVNSRPSTMRERVATISRSKKSVYYFFPAFGQTSGLRYKNEFKRWRRKPLGRGQWRRKLTVQQPHQPKTRDWCKHRKNSGSTQVSGQSQKRSLSGEILELDDLASAGTWKEVRKAQTVKLITHIRDTTPANIIGQEWSSGKKADGLESLAQLINVGDIGFIALLNSITLPIHEAVKVEELLSPTGKY